MKRQARHILLSLMLFVLPTGSAICENVTPPDEVTISIISPKDSSLWVGTTSHGLLRVGATGRPFSYSTLTGHLSCDRIDGLTFDDEGTLWILDGQGIIMSYSSLDGFVKCASESVSPAVKTALFNHLSGDVEPSSETEPENVSNPSEIAKNPIPWYGRWWSFVLFLVILCLVAYFVLRYYARTSYSSSDNRIIRRTDSQFENKAPVSPVKQSRGPVVTPSVNRTDSTPKVSSVVLESGFAETVASIIEKRFQNPDFGVEEIAVELGISRVHLSRKLKAAGVDSPSDMIKKRRMEEAARLIRSGESNMATVAIACGFSSAAYFSSAFKQYYGQTPSSFI